jgi:hypothetical protein
MKSTSPTFSPFAIERDVDCNITFDLLDENAKDNAAPSVSEADISQLAQLTDGITATKKYATLEPNSWALDGSFDILPDDISEAQTGWWSGMSGADSMFEAAPALSFYFGGLAISTIGFTLYFDGSAGVPTQIRITTYGADQATIIKQDTFSNSRAFFVADMLVQNYYKVTFEFLATSKPHRRVRVSECLFGIVQNFDRDSLETVSILYAADLISESLPSRQLIFKFDNSDHKYNLINPSGLYAYLQEGQDIHTSIKINGESVYMGAFEFMSASADDDGIIGQITGSDFILPALDGAVIAGSNTTKTLSEAVSDILAGLDVAVSLAYPSASVVTAYPEGTTRREALRLLSQASCCSAWVDRDGVLQIHPLEVGEPMDELTADRMPSMGGISVSEPVDCVTLTVRNEYHTDIEGEFITVENIYTAGSGRRTMNVDNPCVLPASGQAVADWLLAQFNRRVKYDKLNRGNPAIEIDDTLKVYDAYGEDRNAVVTGLVVTFGADGLSAQTKAVGE